MNAFTSTAANHEAWEHRQLDEYLDGEEDAPSAVYYCEAAGIWKDGENGRFLSPEQALKLAKGKAPADTIKELKEEVEWKRIQRESARKYTVAA